MATPTTASAARSRPVFESDAGAPVPPPALGEAPGDGAVPADALAPALGSAPAVVRLR
jgi:hypothetical protein